MIKIKRVITHTKLEKANKINSNKVILKNQNPILIIYNNIGMKLNTKCKLK